MLNWGDALKAIVTVVAALVAGRQQMKGKADQEQVEELKDGQARLTRLLDRMIFVTEQHIQLQFYSLDDHNRITHDLPETYRPPFQRWNQNQRQLILDYSEQVGRVKSGDGDSSTFTSAMPFD
jgi:hypothetical protein